MPSWSVYVVRRVSASDALEARYHELVFDLAELGVAFRGHQVDVEQYSGPVTARIAAERPTRMNNARTVL
jgi:hypothetical protein